MVRLKGLTSRAKSRINQHGPEFILQDVQPSNKTDKDILVESTRLGMSLGSRKIPWGGWFTIGRDVEVLERKKTRIPA